VAEEVNDRQAAARLRLSQRPEPADSR
jgi:hypothetical protein